MKYCRNDTVLKMTKTHKETCVFKAGITFTVYNTLLILLLFLQEHIIIRPE